jgi:hypothetical protein
LTGKTKLELQQTVREDMLQFMVNSHFRLYNVARSLNPGTHPLSQEDSSKWSFWIKREYEQLRDSSRKKVYEFYREGRFRETIKMIEGEANK